MQQETVIVLDFGGQYNQLIARRVRECNVYCEIYSYRTDLAKIKAKNPKGIIFTGGPNSAYLPDSPTIDPEIYNWGVPILGICYGSQLMMHMLGGKVCKAPEREYGKTLVDLDTASPLFDTLPAQNVCWMSHNDYIEQAAPGFEIVAHTPNCPVAAAQDKARGLYAVQFHPEVLHTENGTKILHNFVYNICRCAGDWKMDSFVENSVKALREKIGDGKVLCALSGGVDSSVCAAMLAKAIGKQLTCVFVDHGLLRKNEREQVCEVFGEGGQFDINFVCVDARDRFYKKLAGQDAPERKRKIIGEEFIRVFEDEAKKIGAVDFWHRVRFTPTWSSPASAANLPQSRATTTSAVCPTTLTLRKSSSRCATCSRTRSVRLAVSWACRSTLSPASRSPARAWPSASSAM